MHLWPNTCPDRKNFKSSMQHQTLRIPSRNHIQLRPHHSQLQQCQPANHSSGYVHANPNNPSSPSPTAAMNPRFADTRNSSPSPKHHHTRPTAPNPHWSSIHLQAHPASITPPKIPPEGRRAKKTYHLRTPSLNHLLPPPTHLPHRRPRHAFTYDLPRTSAPLRRSPITRTHPVRKEIPPDRKRYFGDSKT